MSLIETPSGIWKCPGGSVRKFEYRQGLFLGFVRKVEVKIMRVGLGSGDEVLNWSWTDYFWSGWSAPSGASFLFELNLWIWRSNSIWEFRNRYSMLIIPEESKQWRTDFVRMLSINLKVVHPENFKKRFTSRLSPTRLNSKEFQAKKLVMSQILSEDTQTTDKKQQTVLWFSNWRMKLSVSKSVGITKSQAINLSHNLKKILINIKIPRNFDNQYNTDIIISIILSS